VPGAGPYRQTGHSIANQRRRLPIYTLLGTGGAAWFLSVVKVSFAFDVLSKTPINPTPDSILCWLTTVLANIASTQPGFALKKTAIGLFFGADVILVITSVGVMLLISFSFVDVKK
jgi:hypothetical protein